MIHKQNVILQEELKKREKKTCGTRENNKEEKVKNQKKINYNKRCECALKTKTNYSYH